MVAFENAFSLCWVSLAVLLVLSALARLAKMHFEKSQLNSAPKVLGAKILGGK